MPEGKQLSILLTQLRTQIMQHC